MGNKEKIESLMAALGYDHDLFRVDFYNQGYFIQNKENEMQKVGLLICETEITKKDEISLLNLLGQSVDWGIITDGKKIVLVNKNVETSMIEHWKTGKIVLEEKLSGKNTGAYLKYFTRKELFVTRNSLYYKDIVQYRNTQYRGNEESWAGYNSSLKRFFNHYVEKCGGDYDGYEKFTYADFESFIMDARVHSPSSIVNMYAHVSVYLRDKIGIRRNGFELSRKEVLKSFTGVQKEELGDILDKRRLKEINIFFQRKKKDQLRNLTIFYLAVCYGIERRQICQLQWSQVKWEKEEITLDNVNKPLPKQLLYLLKQLQCENKQKGYPDEFVFYTERNGKVSPITKDVVNRLFSSLTQIDKDDPIYTQYSLAKIRRTLAGILLKDLPLDEVMYLLSIEAENLGAYLTSEEIYVQAKIKLDEKKENMTNWHPMEKVLEGVFCDGKGGESQRSLGLKMIQAK